MKKLIPALCLLLISAVVMSTASFAWFSMNTQVKAKGMTVKANAQNGIVISDTVKETWSAETSSTTTKASLYPTSTADGTNWYVNASTNAAQSTGSDYVGDYKSVPSTDAAKYYQENKFYIRSSTNEAQTKNLFIKSVTVTKPATEGTANLNKSLRVLVMYGSNVYIYAPETRAEYTVNGETAVTPLVAGTTENQQIGTTSISIPKKGDTPLEVKIYVYFEGEDPECKSDNLDIDNLDELTVSVTFEAKDATT